MKYTTYFSKTGRIFGLSSKCEFSTWNHRVYLFTDLRAAEKWLETEEADFRERELCSKARAESFLGKLSEADIEEAQRRAEEWIRFHDLVLLATE